MQSTTLGAADGFTEFTARIEREFIQGSGISPELYRLNIKIVRDTEIGPGGEPIYPINEALNWSGSAKCGHFGFQIQVRTEQFAALIQQETGETFQAKLAYPRPNKDKPGQIQKYETPTGAGSRAYFASVGPETRAKIAERYGVDVPMEGSFWDWVAEHPWLPIIFTEGAKKALALLSQGYIAIALTGCHGGYRSKDALGNPLLEGPHLIPALARFCAPGRAVIIALDQDAKPETKYRVDQAIGKFGRLLQGVGCTVKVAQWESAGGSCKGVDDLVVNAGRSALELALALAKPLIEWEIWQHLVGQLTWKPSFRVITADLSTLKIQDLPELGIIGIASGKGTGKTKLIGGLVVEDHPALSLGHRVALMRNLSERLNLNYRDDVDRVHGRFIAGNAYTLRLGLCVDSLLSINPADFAGCDLIIDEACQVFRHLLTSDTCRKNGQLAALLERIKALIQVARRVILADADLNNAALEYVRDLRGKGSSVFLIRNDYTLPGYEVDFIHCSNQSAIVARLRQDALNIPPGKVLYTATDSKAMAKQLTRLLQEDKPSQRILLINSETSGGEMEQEFITTPDQVLARGDYDIIIATPSVATGVSMESNGIFDKVYGIFTGVSSTDADMSQSLARVREPVQRVVWCAKTGRNFGKISREIHPWEVQRDLEEVSQVNAAILKILLKADDHHGELWCKITAEQNRAMAYLRTALKVRLEWEGNQVRVIDGSSVLEVRERMSLVREQIQLEEALAIVTAPTLSRTEAKALERKANLSPPEQAALTKFHLADFYCVDLVDFELVEKDRNGQRRGEISALEHSIYSGLALERDQRQIEKQASYQCGFISFNLPTAELKRKGREYIELQGFIQKLLTEPELEWDAADLKPLADRARRCKKMIKKIYNFTITDKVSDTQIVHQLLSQQGVKLTYRREKRRGGMVRIYSLEREHWAELMAIVERRKIKRQELATTSSKSVTPGLNQLIEGSGGVTTPEEGPQLLQPPLQPLNLAAPDSGINSGDWPPDRRLAG